MAITYVGIETHHDDSCASSESVNVPSGVQDDDLLILYIQSYNVTTQAFTEPAAFTDIDEFTETTSTDKELYVGYRVASSEPASYSVSFAQTGIDVVIALVAYRGVDTTTPFATTYVKGSHYVQSSSGTVGSYAPAAIAAEADDWVVVNETTSHINNYTTSAGPSGYTLRYGDTDGGTFGNGFVLADKAITTGTTETPGNWGSSASTSTQYQGFTFALNPALTLSFSDGPNVDKRTDTQAVVSATATV